MLSHPAYSPLKRYIRKRRKKLESMDNQPHQQHKTLKTRLASCTNTRVKSAFKYRPSNPIKLSIRSDIPFRGLSDPLTAPIFCRIRGTWDDVPRGWGEEAWLASLSALSGFVTGRAAVFCSVFGMGRCFGGVTPRLGTWVSGPRLGVGSRRDGSEVRGSLAVVEECRLWKGNAENLEHSGRPGYNQNHTRLQVKNLNDG